MPQQLSNKSSFVFKDFLRLIFVIFSLYLMGDAFNRWDGFSYYASFAEFLPAVALAFILWTIVSISAAIVAWMLSRLFEWFCDLIGIEIRVEHLLIYALLFVLFGVLAWKVKKLLWPNIQTTFHIKLAVFLLISGVSIFMAWLFRGKARQWAGIIRERITPLVWIFGMLVLVAFPVVFYHTWFENTDKTISRKVVRDISTDKKRPNIILVTFDALAARDMSAYGYYKETTPFIGRWAENATVFRKAEAASNFTTPSVASLMTGKRVWTHQTYHIEGMKPVRGKVESLPAVLKDNGYFNVALVVNPFASVKVLGMSDSFDMAPPASEFGASVSLFGCKFGVIDKILYRTFGEKIRLHNWIIRNDFILSKIINLISRNISRTTVPPDNVFNRFLDITGADLPKPFFAWIHVFPPHDPYLPPEPYRGKFNASSELRTYKRQEQLVEESYKYLFQYRRYPEEMQAAVNLMRDYYDEFIRYCDTQFEEFTEKLNSRKIKNTVMILTADHGESFENGYFTHGGPFLYEQVTHIPLVIKEPDQGSGQIIDDIVEQIDIPATILGLAKIPVPEWMEGRSLVPLMRGDKLPVRPAFTMNLQENRSRGHKIVSGSVAVREGEYKLIHYLQKNESLLFNLKNDPDELVNVFYREPEMAQRLLGLINDNIYSINKELLGQG